MAASRAQTTGVLEEYRTRAQQALKRANEITSQTASENKRLEVGLAYEPPKIRKTLEGNEPVSPSEALLSDPLCLICVLPVRGWDRGGLNPLLLSLLVPPGWCRDRRRRPSYLLRWLSNARFGRSQRSSKISIAQKSPRSARERFLSQEYREQRVVRAHVPIPLQCQGASQYYPGESDLHRVVGSAMR